MNCSDLAEHYELYALGVLEEPERSELREHLARNCEVCTPNVRRAATQMPAFSSLAPDVELPKDLRGRVLASVGIVPQFRWNWMQTWATVAGCLLIGLFWFEHLRAERVREVTFQKAMQETKQANAEAAQLKGVLALLNAPETIVRVTSEGAAKPQGKVFLNPREGVLLLASNLPPAPDGKIYEMWIIPAGGKPVPAGLFQTEADGTAVYMQAAPVDVAATGAVAVTPEPTGGSPQPTSRSRSWSRRPRAGAVVGFEDQVAQTLFGSFQLVVQLAHAFAVGCPPESRSWRRRERRRRRCSESPLPLSRTSPASVRLRGRPPRWDTQRTPFREAIGFLDSA